MAPLRIGLALSGGSAKGLAHVGVLRVLEREGVPVDVVAGTRARYVEAYELITGRNFDDYLEGTT